MAVLVTGFEPFAGPLHNPSQARLEHLPGSIFGQKLIRTQTMANHLYRSHPAFHLGLSVGRSLLSLDP